MIKTKSGLIALGIVALNATLAFMMVGHIFMHSVAAEDIVINETSYFEGVDDGHTYKCYTIQGDDTAIAIGWLHSETNTIPTTLNIPSSITSDALTGSDVTYTVKAIAKGGFRRCTFTTVNLPNTIEDIRQEAFAYCENMTSFQLPYGKAGVGLKEIAPSTFMDCRSLTTFYYSDSTGARKLGNDTIETIGDHAFDSCVNLTNFLCPTNVRTFGKSCFQKCSSLLYFNFPNDNEATGDDHNEITVESFAFADCIALADVYFEPNVVSVADYAFVDSKPELTFKYTGLTTPVFSEHWRDRKITTSDSTIYQLLTEQTQIIQHPSYPGLYYTLDTAEVQLDNARTNSSVVIIPEQTTKYAIITGFHAPFESQAGYWDKTNGILTIPNTIPVSGVDYTVKVIGDGAFAGNKDLRKVIFNEDLVQIKNKAFFGDVDITELDFSACEKLVEISYSQFNEPVLKNNKNPLNCDTKSDVDVTATQKAENTQRAMHQIKLPYCLEYLGNFAFYNFTNLTDGIFFTCDAREPHLKLIGDYCFAVVAANSTAPETTEVNLVLPASLDDDCAEPAQFFHTMTYEKPKTGTVDSSMLDNFAVGRCAFEHQKCLRTVVMAPSDSTTQKTSFAPNAFRGSTNLISFRANRNIFLIGMDFFKDCSDIREIFLCSDRADSAANTKYNYPWGCNDFNYNYGSSLLKGNVTKKDAVVYVNGAHAPKMLYTNPPSGADNWNVEAGASYINELNYKSDETSGSIRYCVPTFYNIDWLSGGSDVTYWHKNKTVDTYPATSGPTTLNEYKNGYIAIVKDKTTNKYTVAKYFTDSTTDNVNDEIDLTTLSIANDIDTIGDEAFACDDSSGKNIGYYFVLPRTIVNINERAFYRKGSSLRGVRIVTYKDSGGTIQVPTGETRTYAQIKTAINGASDANKIGYCVLPASVSKIKRNAFYNHIFGSIELGSGLTYLGNAAFLTYNASNANRGRTTSISFTGSSASGFTIDGNGIYYTGNAAKKMLLSQANGISGGLTIVDGTKAVGFRAVACSKYTSVAFPSDDSLTHIYGCAFKGSRSLAEITNLDSIQYISAFGDTEIYDTSLPFDNIDFRDFGLAETSDKYTLAARFGAFQDCVALATVNFKTMTGLKKIGWAAFKGCKALKNMTGTDSYSFYNASETLTETLSTNVLDLTECTNFKSVEKEAFVDCDYNSTTGNGIKYVITKNSTGANYTANPTNYYGKDSTGKSGSSRPFPATAIVLCGETFFQADPNGTASSRLTYYPKYDSGKSSILGTFANVYYRVHSTSDISPDYATGRKYWTLTTDGKYIMFENKSEAETWLGVAANVARQAA